MKNNAKSILGIIVSLFSIVSCNNITQKRTAFENIINIKCKVIVNDLPMKLPGGFDIMDSVFVIDDPLSSGPVLQLYHKQNGKLLLEGGKRGRGPLEIIMPFGLIARNGVIGVFDPSLHKYVNYHVNLKDSTLTSEAINLNSLEMSQYVIPFNQDKWISVSFKQGAMFSYVNLKEKSITDFGEFPVNNFKQINNGFEVFQGRFKLSDSERYAVYTCNATPYFCVFDIEDVTFHKKFEFFLEQPNYNVVDNELKWDESNLSGFMDVAMGNSIYLLHADFKHKELKARSTETMPRFIYEYSFDGEPICKYITDYPVLRIACDENGVLYGISLIEDMYKVVELIKA